MSRWELINDKLWLLIVGLYIKDRPSPEASHGKPHGMYPRNTILKKYQRVRLHNCQIFAFTLIPYPVCLQHSEAPFGKPKPPPTQTPREMVSWASPSAQPSAQPSNPMTIQCSCLDFLSDTIPLSLCCLNANRAATRYLCDGFSKVFRAPFLSSCVPMDCNNLKSAWDMPTDVTQKVSKECTVGRVDGPFSSLPIPILVFHGLLHGLHGLQDIWHFLSGLSRIAFIDHMLCITRTDSTL